MVDCISDIFSPPIAKHLALIRLKHLTEAGTIQSGIRALMAAQWLNNTPPATDAGVAEGVKTGGCRAASGRGITKTGDIEGADGAKKDESGDVHIYFAKHPHVA